LRLITDDKADIAGNCPSSGYPFPHGLGDGGVSGAIPGDVRSQVCSSTSVNLEISAID
jgi:hypothetical protein